ncbi:MAG: AraC family transcriptional regulator [Blautia faecis]
MKKALRYIDEHYLEYIDIPAISGYGGILGLPAGTLYNKKNGCTINTYINRKRMEQAAFLLCNSTLHITDIAFSSGYNNRQHFAHTFEKFYHMSPSRYRSLHDRFSQIQKRSGTIWPTD